MQYASKARRNNNTSDSQLDAIKMPPHSVEAEQSVLGGLMLDNQTWDMIAGKLAEGDFYRPEHRMIFGVLEELSRRNQPFDVLTVSEALKSRNQLDDAGSDVYLFELAKNTPSAANIGAYAEIVRERSILRQMLHTATEMADMAYHPDGRSSNELLDIAEQKIFKMAEQGERASGPVKLTDYLAIASEQIDRLYHSDGDLVGVSTGFQELDNMTSGLSEADLVIVAGRPSMGKTAFAMNIAENVAIRGDAPVLVFSMEMPGEALAMRMMSSLGRINQNSVRTGKLSDDDWPRLSSAVSMLSEAKMLIDDTPALSPAEVRSRARRVAREHGKLGLIVIDYLQLMQVPGMRENRTLEISEISRSLKALAKEMSVPVMALSQLNRSLEQRTDKRPMMSDLRESGAIEQDADIIIFIYRDEVYNPDTAEKGGAEIIIAKQRNGPIGRLRLTFMGQYTRFENYMPTSYIGEMMG
ncbi:MAG: replicative DNA helicase [Pseudomonadota bacterium]|nr:replicative DNA helicase [Pseudomonadota bacterium]